MGQRLGYTTRMVLTVICDEMSEYFVFNKQYFEHMSREDVQNILVSHEKLKGYGFTSEAIYSLLIIHRDLLKSAIEQKLNIQLDFMPRGFSRSLTFNHETQKFLEFVVKNFAERQNELKGKLLISTGIIKDIKEEMDLKGFGQFSAKEIRDNLRAHKKWLLNAFKEEGKLMVS